MSTALLKVGIGLAIALAAFAWHRIDRSAAYADGQRAERVIWQQRQAEAEAKAEADRKAAQEKINAAERSYLLTRAAADVQKSDLMKALDNEKASARARANVCAAVTRELRDRLQDIRGTDP